LYGIHSPFLEAGAHGGRASLVEAAVATGPVRADRKLALLRKAALFSKLQKADLAVLSRSSGWAEHAAGQVIFRAGSEADELFLIDTGNVVIRKPAETGAEQDIARFVAGEAFGELDLLDTVPRSASAIAEADVRLLVFPSPGLRFRDVIEEHPTAFARILQHLLGEISGRIRAANRLVSERTPWVQELRRQLLRDKLTGLANRAFLDEELPAALSAHAQSAVLVVKPDAFKTINDSFGHEAGDRTLRALAETIKASLGEGDIGARYRGDEFCVVLTGRSAADGRGAGERLRAAVRSMDLRPIIGDVRLAFTASVGAAALPAQAPDARAAVALAHARMMEARAAGGDRVAAGDAG
jgi:diguanylate cyclase